VSEDERADLTGQTLDGRYRIERRIGLGGTGVVFQATQLRDNSKVALKTLRPCFVDHPDLGRRLRREAGWWRGGSTELLHARRERLGE